MKKVRSKLHPTEIGAIKTFSLSPNDEIGEIAVECSGCTYYYNNLAELCEKWEDYEEPTTYYYISDFGAIREGDVGKFVEDEIVRKKIGNYFDTEEEAKKAVEKLEAWKRLKDNCWKPVHYNIATREASVIFSTGYTITEQDRKDLDLLFGGEE